MATRVGAARRRIPGLATGEVLGRLYNAGVLTSRDELAVFSDLLLGHEATRTISRTKRRWSEEQYQAIEAALVIGARLGLDPDGLLPLLQGDVDAQVAHLRARFTGGVVDVARVKPAPASDNRPPRAVGTAQLALPPAPEGMTA